MFYCFQGAMQNFYFNQKREGGSKIKNADFKL